MTEIVAAAAGDRSFAERMRVLISEAPDGGLIIFNQVRCTAQGGESA